MDRLRHPRVRSSSIMGRGNQGEREGERERGRGDVKFQMELPQSGGEGK